MAGGREGPHRPDDGRGGEPNASPAGRARPRHRQAGDRRRRPLFWGTRRSERSWRAGCSTASTSRRRPGRPSSTSFGSTCSATSGVWGDPAVRRFLAKIGPAAIDDLFALREADNAGSNVARDADDLDELRARIRRELADGPILDRSALAIDGADLTAELGMTSGSGLGRILGALFEQVVQNPGMNDKASLFRAGRDLAAEAHSSGELSVQLHAVRSALVDDLEATLGRLAELGFRRVEPYDLLAFRDGLRAGLPAHGLAAPTAHCELLSGDIDAVLDAASELGIGIVVQPWVSPDRWQTAAGVGLLADEMNAVARSASNRGLGVGYHNHHFELASMIDGRHALEVFADLLAPDVALEVDAYWAFSGGADVPALLRRLDDRVVALHVKDGDGTLDTSRQVAVGSGVLPIRDILAAAPSALRVVELDDTVGDMFEAIRASRAFVLGASDQASGRASGGHA